MPRRNKRKSFGRNFKNKSSKSSNRDAASATTASKDDDTTRYDESESDEENATTSNKTTTEDSERLASVEVLNESAKSSAMGQQESVVHPEINTGDDVSTSANVSPKDDCLATKATIKLKVVQFVGDDPKETGTTLRGDDSHSVQKIDVAAEFNEIGNDDDDNNVQDNKSITKADFSHIDKHILQHKRRIEVDVVPKLDEKSSSQYRVESPRQILNDSTHHHMKSKRHAMLIQEISESSSSEEVKEFLNSAVVRKHDTSPTKCYRVDSPDDAFDNNNNNLIEEANKLSNDVVTFHEVSESSSNESVKNEMMSSAIANIPPKPQKAVLKIINIRELPPENEAIDEDTTTKTKVKSKDNSPRLNKAEEAMLEALYGDKKLLEIPNFPLDVISEEGSDCGSDIERNQASTRRRDFEISSPPQKPPRNSRRRQEIVEQPILISTKIVEMESNIPESSETWESRVVGGDNELEAELVYLTSASSSATDLSQCGNSTDTEDIADNSEDTETNSILDNVCVPSFEDVPIEMKMTQDFSQEPSEQKLDDILEEDEDLSHRSSIAITSNENQQHTEILSNCEFNDDNDDEVCGNEEENHAISQRIEDDGIEEQNETITDDDKKISYDNDKTTDEIVCRLTPILSKRKNSSDSSSSANSQCTIIRQSGAMSSNCVHPLNELCLQSLNRSAEDIKITIQKKLNSSSRNAPQIPTINELELHYKCDNSATTAGDEINLDRDSGGVANQIITILQVPPEITRSDSTTEQRWVGMQSTQVPNLMLALSPLQNSYLSSQDSPTTSADVLLDMHKKFVERRAYHEVNVDTLQRNSPPTSNHVSFTFHTNESRSSESEVRTNDDGYSADRENSVDTFSVITRKSPDSICTTSEANVKCDKKLIANVNDADEFVNSHEKLSNMQSIRKCMRDEFFKSVLDTSSECDNNNIVEVSKDKRFHLEDELVMLDKERANLEDELRNIQSLQHFKFEELQYAKRKIEQNENDNDDKIDSPPFKFSNDEFIEFVNSNEHLQQELYNEWQDKILERYERKMQKTVKLTNVNNEIESSDGLKFSNLENEFMSKLRERRERLSLPNEITSSTESVRDQKSRPPPPAPQVMHEFLKFYEEEFSQNKNSDESGELKTKSPMLISLISVSFLCGLLIGKYLTLNKTV